MTLHFQRVSYSSCGSTLATNSGDQLFYAFKTFMKGVGWTVPQSSDGISFDQSGVDKITGAGSGAGGLANASSWYILKEPSAYVGQRREFLFQKNSPWSVPSDGCYRNIWYSVQGFQTGSSSNSGFGSAAISATNYPIAYDMFAVNPAGQTTQSPTFWTSGLGNASQTNQFIPYFDDGSSSQRIEYMFCASDAAPYFWYILGYKRNVRGAGGVSSGIYNWHCYNPLTAYDSSDGDPAVLIGMTNLSSWNTFFSAVNNWTGGGYQTASWWNWVNFSSKSDATAKIVTAATSGKGFNQNAIPIFTTNGGLTNSFHTAASPYSSNLKNPKVVLMPTVFGIATQTGTQIQVKGSSSNILTAMGQIPAMALVTVSSAKDYLALDNGVAGSSQVLVPWDGQSLSF